ncbi:MAG: transketolase [Ignavibacteriales bacterium]|nr:MAG: transketolase [Ignavibacteriaceae bacterium]MBW7873673.1 transketolase [Ignavibacteria bacterium]MCZ2143898.1 transketolase [Ignavibacteriales bacterium]MBV6444577.1 Transketolase [Ignavibacteriaceae bacterium]MBZ0197528.1 transketolase [Ignavibacteriaceae bacterium]
MDISNLSINTIRTLAIDAVQKANSGHPGAPMGLAPLGYFLFHDVLNFNPKNPKWLNRDRFVLSGGHGSMLLYSLLHLSGYDLSLEDIKNFRRWGSKTPGHPERGETDGVEVTTGPLGQGFSNAVGMALAFEFMAFKFNKPGFNIFDHRVYAICGDGDLMEGISHEAASFAGNKKLSRLVVFYDDNGISIDGSTSLAFTDDTEKRFLAYGWNVYKVYDVNNLEDLRLVLHEVKSSDRPSLVITKSHIGFGSPNKQDTAKVHGSPLGDEEIKLTKQNLGWHYTEPFTVPEEVREHFASAVNEKIKIYDEWTKLFAEYSEKYPEDAAFLNKVINGEPLGKFTTDESLFPDLNEKLASRASSQKVINTLPDAFPTLLGGSADLTESNLTDFKGLPWFSASERGGRNIHYGVREIGMGGVMNGIAAYGGVIPFGGTFLVFTDYMRPTMRMAAMQKLHVIYVITHDSIGLGEDGPTHQPIEQLMSLRLIPGLTVIRPADSHETVYAWKAALENTSGPTTLVLSRQGLPVITDKSTPASGVLRGAYTVRECAGTPDVILIGTGSELLLAVKAAGKLSESGKKVRVVSMPSWELFEKQSAEYKESILPAEVKNRVAIEAGVPLGWEKYTGDNGTVIGINKFGASAPAAVIFEKYGLTVEAVVAAAG